MARGQWRRIELLRPDLLPVREIRSRRFQSPSETAFDTSTTGTFASSDASFRRYRVGKLSVPSMTTS